MRNEGRGGAANGAATRWQFGNFQVDSAERTLLHRDRPLRLREKPFELLTLLLSRAPHLVEKEALRRELWPGASVHDNNLAVTVSALRKALEGKEPRAHAFIQTVPKRGYRWAAPAHAASPAASGTDRARARAESFADPLERRGLAIEEPARAAERRGGRRQDRTPRAVGAQRARLGAQRNGRRGPLRSADRMSPIWSAQSAIAIHRCRWDELSSVASLDAADVWSRSANTKLHRSPALENPPPELSFEKSVELPAPRRARCAGMDRYRESLGRMDRESRRGRSPGQMGSTGRNHPLSPAARR